MTRLPRPALALVGVVVVAAVVGGGAGLLGGDGASDERPPATTGSEAGQEGGAARPGGSLTIALERPPSLDPAEADRGIQAELVVADILFDGLTSFDPRTSDATPALAERWASNEDLTLWSFQLRAGARFHDGTPVRAEDVRVTLERIARRGQSSAASVQLEGIAGYRELVVDRTADRLSGVIVKDERTVEIQLTEGSATLPLMLSNPVYGVVPAAAAQAAEPPFGRRPVGSGPYRIERVDGDVVTLARAPGAEGLLDEVVLRFFDSAAGAYDVFADGGADFTRVPAERVSEAAGTFGGKGFVPYGAELFYGLNLRQPKFADARFREAIVRAIDREAIVNEVYGGTVLPLDAIVPAGVPGHTDGVCPCDHDPARAQRLLEEAFAEGDVPIVYIDFDEGSPQDTIAEHIRRDLEAVGIPALLRGRPFDDGTDDDYQSFVASGDQELFRLGWIGPYPSPEAYLGPLFASGSPDNVVGFSDGEVDAALVEARRQVDAAARRRLFATAERRVLSSFPIVPLVQFQTHAVWADRVRGVEVTVAGTFDITKVWVTDAPSTSR